MTKLPVALNMVNLALQQPRVETNVMPDTHAGIVPHEEGNICSAAIVMMQRLHDRPTKRNTLTSG